MMFYFLVCWKLPFYMLLMSVDLPEDATVIKRQVSYTDVYNPHILLKRKKKNSSINTVFSGYEKPDKRK